MIMTQFKAFQWKARLKASLIHLAISVLIAALAAWLVFALWYPYPYRDTSGGRALFLIVVTVDVILGPLITFTVFNRNKPKSELVRDMLAVALIQASALAYGLWTMSAARPVHLVFEFDRFRVVHAIEIPEELLSQTPVHISALPLTGPTLLAVRPFRDVNEEVTATLMALQGLPLSARPDLWQSYLEARQRVIGAAKPLNELGQRFPQQKELIGRAVEATGLPADKLLYLPMNARMAAWTVLLDATNAEVRGFIQIDSF